MEKFKGLGNREAAEKLKEFGPNEIKEVHKISVFKILLRQIRKNFVIYLLGITAIASFALGKGLTGFVIVLVIAIVVITGFVQEYRADKAISALRKMIMPVSRVIREGREIEIPSEQIVPEDIIILRTGERIPADCLILEEVNLKTNESILTGESSDIKKTASTPTKSAYKDGNLVFMGTYVVSGRCIVRALHTGMNTKFGKIAGMISTAEKYLPLQDKVNRIAKYMAFVGILAAILTALIMFGRADVITGDVIAGILIVAIAISVSSFPEGFPVVLITTLAAGVNRMAKQNAVVNRMSIIETLGETSVICSDKTGTITKGEMTVRKIYSENKFFEVSGIGYEAKGSILENGKEVDIEKNKTILEILKCSTLCNDSNIERLGEDSLYKIIGSSTEGALLILAAKHKLFKESFSNPRVKEMPFDPKRKMMSILYGEDGEKTVYVKGAPESILQRCKFIQTEKGVEKISDIDKKAITEANSKLTAEALRTLGLAYKPNKNDSYTEEELIFLGLVGMEDPPREEVASAIAVCAESGIKVKMITGDNPQTAKAIAEQIGMSGNILTGAEIDQLSDEELTKLVVNTVIFARVKPEDKLRIVKALKENHEVITMTGDGVNDAPALKEAHIGIAMGTTGTDVSRSVADITLKDDNFATIVTAIKEGRTIFNNIRKFVTYQLACNLTFIYIIFIGMLVAPYLGWFVPIISALQILIMNVVIDNIPALTLGFNPTSADIMTERPRKNTQILTGEFITLFLINGLIMGIIIFCVAYLSFNILPFEPEVARTTVLVSLILMQIANAFNFRSFRYRVLNRGLLVNKYLFVASIISVSITLLIVYVPFLRNIFETTPLNALSWLIAMGAALAIVVIFDIQKTINNRTRFFLKSAH